MDVQGCRTVAQLPLYSKELLVIGGHLETVSVHFVIVK